MSGFLSFRVPFHKVALGARIGQRLTEIQHWCRGASLSGLGLVLISLSAVSSHAEEPEGKRFEVKGERLVYDTTVAVNGETLDIRYSDVEGLRRMLRKNKGINVLEIRSTGGGHYPAMDIAALIIDFGLDTHVDDVCESSCVSIFLAGEKRTMARGARMGFHQLSWNDAAVEEYYNKHRKRREWDTPFEFAAWMYQDTQTETFNRLNYMLRRGVDAHFAIQTIRKPDTSMWFPYRSVLLAAGVLTE